MPACTLAIGGQFAHRYLLPSVACAAVLVGLGLAAALGRGRAAAAAGALLVLGGAWSALEFRRVSPLGYDVQENVSGMRDLLAFLEHERIHHVYCLDAQTGKLLWKAGVQPRLGSPGTFYSTPAVAYGRVYIGSTDGKVYSFGAASGRLRWCPQGRSSRRRGRTGSC